MAEMGDAQIVADVAPIKKKKKCSAPTPEDKLSSATVFVRNLPFGMLAVELVTFLLKDFFFVF